MKAVTQRPAAPDASPPGLERVLGTWDLAALAVGCVIGTGIFVVPGMVVGAIHSPWVILLAWVLVGLLSSGEALLIAELATLLPHQGGDFVYLNAAFGPFLAFFRGWVAFLVGYPCSAAAIAMVFSVHLRDALGLPEDSVGALASAALVITTAGTLRGTRSAFRVQGILTGLKIALVALLGIFAVVASQADWSRLGSPSEAAWPGFSALAAGMIPVYWTYAGWQNLGVVAGETRDPSRTVVRGLAVSLAIVIGLYLLLNVGFLVTLPLDVLRDSDSPATAVATVALGEAAGRAVAGLVALCSFGGLFAIAVSAPRLFYAMAREGLFFEAAGRLDERGNAPRWGSAALLAVSLFYLWTGTFGEIVSSFVAVSQIWALGTILSVLVLRLRRPGAPRPFRAPGIWIVAPCMALISLWVLVEIFRFDPVRNVVGLVVLAASLPVYRLWQYRDHQTLITFAAGAALLVTAVLVALPSFESWHIADDFQNIRWAQEYRDAPWLALTERHAVHDHVRPATLWATWTGAQLSNGAWWGPHVILVLLWLGSLGGVGVLGARLSGQVHVGWITALFALPLAAVDRLLSWNAWINSAGEICFGMWALVAAHRALHLADPLPNLDGRTRHPRRLPALLTAAACLLVAGLFKEPGWLIYPLAVLTLAVPLLVEPRDRVSEHARKTARILAFAPVLGIAGLLFTYHSENLSRLVSPDTGLLERLTNAASTHLASLVASWPIPVSGGHEVAFALISVAWRCVLGVIFGTMMLILIVRHK
ncbi:MAG: amino acid permease [Myxococcota bacterium]|nr:amino acid permease [Myxococcota bacterium]